MKEAPTFLKRQAPPLPPEYGLHSTQQRLGRALLPDPMLLEHILEVCVPRRNLTLSFHWSPLVDGPMLRITWESQICRCWAGVWVADTPPESPTLVGMSAYGVYRSDPCTVCYTSKKTFSYSRCSVVSHQHTIITCVCSNAPKMAFSRAHAISPTIACLHPERLRKNLPSTLGLSSPFSQPPWPFFETWGSMPNNCHLILPELQQRAFCAHDCMQTYTQASA